MTRKRDRKQRLETDEKKVVGDVVMMSIRETLLLCTFIIGYNVMLSDYISFALCDKKIVNDNNIRRF
jgi:hypothetical protein